MGEILSRILKIKRVLIRVGCLRVMSKIIIEKKILSKKVFRELVKTDSISKSAFFGYYRLEVINNCKNLIVSTT